MDIPDMDRFRKVFLKYTKKAFNQLPKITAPKILDVGCGTGVPTIELAKLSKGEIIGLDIDHEALKKFKRKIRKLGLENRVKALTTSFFNNPFFKESIDIIWAEGVFYHIGYDTAFKESYRLLKPHGFLVMVDTLESIEKEFLKTKSESDPFLKLGFTLYKRINWSEKAWWNEYYQPLEDTLKNLRASNIDPENYKHLSQHENEIAMIKENPKKFDCAHFILQKLNK